MTILKGRKRNIFFNDTVSCKDFIDVGRVKYEYASLILTEVN
jgi:hypothetical protein